MADLNICGGAYSLKAPIAVQECINLFPEVQQSGASSRIILRRFPGLKSFATPGSADIAIRGMKKMGDLLYVVQGTTLYSVNSSGTAVSIGTIAGVNLVSMATNGSDLVIVNETSTGYVYNGTLSTISDVDFQSSDRVVYLDTYFIHLKSNSNQFFISESGSATSYIASDVGSKEGRPDNLRSIIASNRDLLLLGEESIEFWRNTGNPDFPFERQEGTFQEQGCRALRSVVEIDNDVFFLGDDDCVYMLTGYQPQRVSHHAIEKWISEQTQAVREAATAMSITHQGHYWYVLSFSTGTWVFDLTSTRDSGEKQWFQLLSNGETNWRVDVVESIWGKTYCGGADGVIYELDQDTYTENGEQQTKLRTTPYYIADKHYISPSRINLGFEQGVGNSDITNPEVAMEISRTWGKTFGNKRYRNMGEAGMFRQQASWARNGYTTGAVLRFTVTDPCDVTITGAWADFGVSNG